MDKTTKVILISSVIVMVIWGIVFYLVKYVIE